MISGWRHGRGVHYHLRLAHATPDWRPAAAIAYCYLLGVYLGDGCMSGAPRTAASLVITLDASYPRIVEETAHALELTFPDALVHHFSRKGGSVAAIRISHPALPFAFPQHGAGRKHKRSIKLLEWQRNLTTRHPEALLRGLIHSDGCRTVNRFSVQLPSGRVGHYEYARYFFSNLSEDIRRIFCEHGELLGIRWTQSNHRNISVSHRDSVALLDQFVGPKR
jgi:hypothetical protein